MKATNKDIPILFFFFGTLLFPFVLRARLFNQFALINIPVWFALFYGHQKNILQLSSPKISKQILLPYFVIGLLLLFLVPGNGWSIKRKILLILIYLLPASLLCSDIRDEELVERYVKIWLICIRSVCIFMCLCRLADAIAGGPVVQNMFAQLYQNDVLEYMISENRLVSYLGHPLSSAGVFLMLLSWSSINAQLYSRKQLPYLVDAGISLLGIFLCASKAALLLAVILLGFNLLRQRSGKQMLVLIAMLVILLMSHVADDIIARVVEGIKNGDLTTGRAAAIEIMLADGTLTFDLLQGHIYEYGNVRMTAALENPFLGWVFTCGLAFAVLQYLMYFVYPGLKVLFSRKAAPFMSMLVLMAYENASNGLYSFNDDLFIYTLNIWLILQVATNTQKTGEA